ncbi:phosphodiester glycosidase family protein [Clostridium sp. BNL1100]|uniref:phosphodiester glycosidase family protein n=1 Tax=Clostridium sp. BNL1100 TaxID=755731 RepID=UPI00024A7B91|nr:phosphodiester glycosidase family protein [Clostridium sp. BNL1100]AEY66160.1 putative periplasmic protein (DUF2233) [Clostridium sp. BNL1100]
MKKIIFKKAIALLTSFVLVISLCLTQAYAAVTTDGNPSNVGTLSDNTIYNYLNIRTYTLTLNGVTNSYPVEIFKSNPSTQSGSPFFVSPAATLVTLNIPNKTVIAKVNGNVQNGYGTVAQVLGLGYFNGVFYQNGIWGQTAQKITSNISDLLEMDFQFFPCFVIKKPVQGSTIKTATIRWFTKKTLADALPSIDTIMPSTNCLVYNGKSVFDQAVYDTSDGGLRIADGSDLTLKNSTLHNNPGTTVDSGKSGNNRTFLGHKQDGSFVMVVAGNMDFVSGAKLMVKLGCDYAVNLDGDGASQMRVASGYTNNAPAGRIGSFGNDSYTYQSCFCIYNN